MSVRIDVGREKVQLQEVRMQKRKVVTVRQTWNRPRLSDPNLAAPRVQGGSAKGKKGQVESPASFAFRPAALNGLGMRPRVIFARRIGQANYTLRVAKVDYCYRG